MENSNPFKDKFIKETKEKAQEWKKTVQELEHNLDIRAIISLQKEVYKTSKNAGAYGFLETAKLCKEISSELLIKSKNLFYSEVPMSWFSKLVSIIENIENNLSIEEKNIVMDEPSEKKNYVIIVDDDVDILKLLNHEFKRSLVSQKL